MIVLIFIIAGILIASKYFKVKNKTYIWWAIGVLGMGLPWAGGGFSFLLIILTNVPLTLQQYLSASLICTAITLFFWMWTITELKYKGKQKIILGIYALIGILFETYLILNLLTNPLVIGIFIDPPLDITYVGLTMLYSMFALATIAISLFLFVGSSLKSDQADIRLKAKFNLIGMISYVIGAVFDAYLSVIILAIFIVRILLISSAIEIYIGWVMPESVKKLFIKSP
jgi:hypothetical protein